MRSVEALLEAELLRSTYEYVYGWLKARAETPDSSSPPGGEELEEALLTRGSDLIELGIARYGFSEPAVRKLFLSAPDTAHGRVLRLAALSNRSLAKNTTFSIEPMPHRLFSEGRPDKYPNEDALRGFVTSAPMEEAEALFQNPTIHDDLLANLYSMEGIFSELTEDRWIRLLDATGGNPRLKKQYSGPMDGYGEYRYSRVFDELWRLAERLPTTEVNASFLCNLLEGTIPSAHSIKDVMALISRWRVDTSRESSDRSWFLRLRLVLTRLVSDSVLKHLRAHEDIAVRCAFYRRCRLNPEMMQEAYGIEPQCFLDGALDNKTVWCEAETRELLRKLCWAEEKPVEMWYANIYKDREGRFRKQHPEWFEDPPMVKEREISLADIAVLLQQIQARQREMVLVFIGIAVVLLILLRR